MSQTYRTLIGVAVSAACLVLVFRSVPIHQLLAALTSVSWVIVLIWVMLASFTLFLRSVRWRILLNHVTDIPFGRVFAAYSAGQLGNAVLPARLGDVFRATSLRHDGVHSGFTLATILGERLLDTGFLVSISALALASFPQVPAWVAHSSRVFAVIAVGGLAFTLIIPRFESQIPSFIGWIAPSKRAASLNNLASQFIGGLRSLRHCGRIPLFVLFTVLIWTVDVLAATTLAHSLEIMISPAITVLLLTSIALSSAVPAAPGNIGVYQLVTISVLTPFAVSRPQAFALGIVLQALIIANLLIWGIGSFWYFRHCDVRERTASRPSSLLNI